MSTTIPAGRPGDRKLPEALMLEASGRLVGLTVFMGLLYGLYAAAGDLGSLALSFGMGETWSTAFLVKAWKQLLGGAALENLYLKGVVLGLIGFVFLLIASPGCWGARRWGRMLFIIACLFLILGKSLGLVEALIPIFKQNAASMTARQYLQSLVPLLPLFPWTWMLLLLVMTTRAAGEWFEGRRRVNLPNPIPTRLCPAGAGSPASPPPTEDTVQFINPAMASSVAVRHHPRGLGGWLVFPAVGIVVYTLAVTVELFAVVWYMNRKYAGPPQLVVTVEAAMTLCLLAFLLVAIGAFFGKRQNAPGLIILIILFELLKRIIVGFMAIKSNVPDFPLYARWFFYIAGGDLLIAIIWIPYFSHSERVQNTFAG